MIIKWFVLNLFLLESVFCWSQNRQYNLCDVNGAPLLGSVSNDSLEFITLDGKLVRLDCLKSINFVGGKDSLDRLVKQKYYSQKISDVEQNQRIMFVLLFDEKLKLVEVRQLVWRFLHHHFYYSNLFVRIF